MRPLSRPYGRSSARGGSVDGVADADERVASCSFLSSLNHLKKAAMIRVMNRMPPPTFIIYGPDLLVCHGVHRPDLRRLDIPIVYRVARET